MCIIEVKLTNCESAYKQGSVESFIYVQQMPSREAFFGGGGLVDTSTSWWEVRARRMRNNLLTCQQMRKKRGILGVVILAGVGYNRDKK